MRISLFLTWYFKCFYYHVLLISFLPCFTYFVIKSIQYSVCKSGILREPLKIEVVISLYPPCRYAIVWLETEAPSVAPGVQTVTRYTREPLPLCVSHNTGNIMQTRLWAATCVWIQSTMSAQYQWVY